MFFFCLLFSVTPFYWLLLDSYGVKVRLLFQLYFSFEQRSTYLLIYLHETNRSSTRTKTRTKMQRKTKTKLRKTVSRRI